MVNEQNGDVLGSREDFKYLRVLGISDFFFFFFFFFFGGGGGGWGKQ